MSRKAASGILTVRVEKAVDLAAMDKNGKSDPYAVVTSTFNKQRFKTKVCKKSLNPVWNETFDFYVSIPSGELHIKLWDKDRWSKDDFLGEVIIPVSSLADGVAVDKFYTVQNEPKSGKLKGQPAGQIKVSLHFPAGKANSAEIKPEVSTAPSRPKTIEEGYEMGEILGKGGFSIVKKARKKDTGVYYAVKIIEKTDKKPEELQLLQREIDIMHKLANPHIITLEDVYETDDMIYLVLELVTGGELFDQIIARGTYSEREAADVIRQILQAINYMHSKGIAHRDLKPENLLCSGPNNNIIKVTDFGLSKDTTGGNALQTSCGTPDYVAPEVLSGQPYDNTVDIWSIGVIAYILLCGFPPFYGKNDQQVFDKILRVDFTFPSPDWDDISDEAKDFIRAILVKDVNARPSAADCLESPWLTSSAPPRPVSRPSISHGLSEIKKRQGK
eukprot:TRINITY_DN10226_c0_g1_i1.p1 TRINITY_DN10226_c0_g1~~TRINITY_DN10226_c0_g1_i1.p1  ORF type:complete len:445 (-),score=117.01 TRINITY_DN10226_c0_g1_i1:48-1382(-)